jgi:hypothetical protein
MKTATTARYTLTAMALSVRVADEIVKRSLTLTHTVA